MGWLIFEKEHQHYNRVQFQFFEMIHSDWLENDSSMAPVAQESEMVELNWEQLEEIQGGGWWTRVRNQVTRTVKNYFEAGGIIPILFFTF